MFDTLETAAKLNCLSRDNVLEKDEEDFKVNNIITTSRLIIDIEEDVTHFILNSDRYPLTSKLTLQVPQTVETHEARITSIYFVLGYHESTSHISGSQFN